MVKAIPGIVAIRRSLDGTAYAAQAEKQDEVNIGGKTAYVWDKETLGQNGTCS